MHAVRSGGFEEDGDQLFTFALLVIIDDVQG
jgi:hypothetical protein